MSTTWHHIDWKSVISELDSTEDGLSQSDAEHRLSRDGANTLESSKTSLITLIANQFQNILVYVLLVALVVSLGIPYLETPDPSFSHFSDAIVILAILVLNTLLGVIQEYRADKAMQSLHRLNPQLVSVYRDKNLQSIPSENLVVGDVVFVEAGNSVPADIRLISSNSLSVNQSILTGESDLIPKSVEAVDKSALMPERSCILYSGTTVAVGSGNGVVIATGPNTQIGNIASLVSHTETPLTPLQHKLITLSRQIGVLVMGLCGVIFILGYLSEYLISDILMMILSIAVSAVPEGLPAIVTLSFAFSIGHLVNKGVLVRHLNSIETLGNVSVICSDKTGTITQNKMSVSQWMSYPDSDAEQLLLTIAASCNDARLPNQGDQMEIALLIHSKAHGVKPLPIDQHLVPFSSENKYMKTQHGDAVFAKGAPETILELSSDEPKLKTQIQDDAKSMMSKGLRVLAFAYEKNKKLYCAGIIGLEDPVRPGVNDAIKLAKDAGIRSIMITGDSPLTATAVAAQIGLDGDVCTGDKLEALSEDALRTCVNEHSIFARILPAQKLLILNALKSQNEIVAMTGDGVNDAPALKGAHVGIAMGLRGTDVAKQASSIVLLDDHFATITNAINEGRRLYRNIQRCIIFLLRANFDELLFISTSILCGWPLPYLPIQILWINLMTDSLPALALSQERGQSSYMNQPPRPLNESILHRQWPLLISGTLISFSLTLGMYIFLQKQHYLIEHTRSILFTLAILIELLMAYSSRYNQLIFKQNPFSNKWLNIAVIIPLALQGMLLYTPIGQWFYMVPLSVNDWVLIVVTALTAMILFEFSKLIFSPITPPKRLS